MQIGQLPHPNYLSFWTARRFRIYYRGPGAAEGTLQSYSKIQELSAKRHKAINQSIVSLVQKNLPSLSYDPRYSFEVASGGDLLTDVVLKTGGKEYHLEFHHLSAAQCRAASMASYIMAKLKKYAIYHQVIPR